MLSVLDEDEGILSDCDKSLNSLAKLQILVDRIEKLHFRLNISFNLNINWKKFSLKWKCKNCRYRQNVGCQMVEKKALETFQNWSSGKSMNWISWFWNLDRSQIIGFLLLLSSILFNNWKNVSCGIWSIVQAR